jgi:four helix bundle protein
MAKRIYSFRELDVYNNAFLAAMEIYQKTKEFPASEKYGLVDQIRRSSRSVCSNLAEAWRKRRYKAAFIAKLSDAESEACETQVWLEFELKCEFLDKEITDSLDKIYERIQGQIVRMIEDADKWLICNKAI